MKQKKKEKMNLYFSHSSNEGSHLFFLFLLKTKVYNKNKIWEQKSSFHSKLNHWFRASYKIFQKFFSCFEKFAFDEKCEEL